MEYQYSKMKIFGFSLIELMTVIVIIGILTAIAIPSYQSYIRQSRTAEALSNISSISQYEEIYYSQRHQYWTAGKNPSAVPSPIDVGGALTFNTSDPDWIQLGALFSNATQVHFQYYAFAGQFDGSAADVTASGLVSSSQSLWPTIGGTPKTTGGVNTCSVGTRSAQGFGVTPVALSNWFVVAAIGDQVVGTGHGGICSLFIKVNDRASIYKENDTE